MNHVGRLLGWGLGLSLMLVSVSHSAEPDRTASSTVPQVTRHTLIELRNMNVVMQRLDYSCGAAALATLMRYYFNEPISEQQILKVMVARLSADELRLKETRGFSLLDLKRAAEAFGYQAAGFKLTINELRKLAAPVIVFIRPLDYNHFAVLRATWEDRVFLADPARGNVRMTVWRFLDEWDGIVFVLGKPGEETIGTHKLSVPRPDDVLAPVNSVYRQWDLGTMGIGLTGRSRFP
jgi:uncharacterized protein